MEKKIRAIGAGIFVAFWAALTLFCWFGPAREMSEAERRPLAQMPEIKAETLFNGKFMGAFEDYTLDQFPLRDTFRSVKALFHKYVLGQRDNNQIYMADGHVAELAPALDTGSVDHALGQFQMVYDLYLQDCGSQIYCAVVPDKSYYLAEANGYPAMDYDAMFSMVETGMPWAEHVNITDCLTIDDYYRTDTHWKQENLLPTAQKLGDAMGIGVPQSYDLTQIQRPFYGVYYGQAALPMEADALQLMESDLLQDCRVYNYVTDSYTAVYNEEKLSGKDMYEVYLSGAQSLLRIENPNATTDRELIVFRDSFGSSLVPLLVQDYKTVTLIDIRYISPQLLGRYVEFDGQDVLFLYSTLVLNKNLI